MSPQLLILVLLATFCHHSESKVSKVIPSWTSLATETERIDNDLEQPDKINGRFDFSSVKYDFLIRNISLSLTI